MQWLGPWQLEFEFLGEPEKMGKSNIWATPKLFLSKKEKKEKKIYVVHVLMYMSMSFNSLSI